MASAPTFGSTLMTTANQVVTLMQAVQLINDRINSDGSLLPAVVTAFAQSRPDLDLATLEGVQQGMVALLNAWNGGSPTAMKALVYKAL